MTVFDNLLGDLKNSFDKAVNVEITVVVDEVTDILAAAVEDIKKLKARYSEKKQCVECMAIKPLYEFYMNGNHIRKKCSDCFNTANKTKKKQEPQEDSSEEQEVKQVIKLKRSNFEDPYDCAVCRGAGDLCVLHEKIEADKDKPPSLSTKAAESMHNLSNGPYAVKLPK